MFLEKWQSISGFSLTMVVQLLAKLQKAENMEKVWKCHAPTRSLEYHEFERTPPKEKYYQQCCEMNEYWYTIESG